MTDQPAKKRRPKQKSPTARSLEECRDRGWPADVVERRCGGGKISFLRDWGGFGDVLALDGKPGALLIQATGDHGGHVQERVRKIAEECAERALAWLAAGNRIEVWGWGRRGAAGTRKLWTLRVVPVTALLLFAKTAEEHELDVAVEGTVDV